MVREKGVEGGGGRIGSGVRGAQEGEQGKGPCGTVTHRTARRRVENLRRVTLLLCTSRM